MVYSIPSPGNSPNEFTTITVDYCAMLVGDLGLMRGLVETMQGCGGVAAGFYGIVAGGGTGVEVLD